MSETAVDEPIEPASEGPSNPVQISVTSDPANSTVTLDPVNSDPPVTSDPVDSLRYPTLTLDANVPPIDDGLVNGVQEELDLVSGMTETGVIEDDLPCDHPPTQPVASAPMTSETRPDAPDPPNDPEDPPSSSHDPDSTSMIPDVVQPESSPAPPPDEGTSNGQQESPAPEDQEQESSGDQPGEDQPGDEPERTPFVNEGATEALLKGAVIEGSTQEDEDENAQASHSVPAAADPPQGEELSAEDKARERRRFVLLELIETEQDYVKDLEKIVVGYMGTIDQMELPEDMQGKDKIVFANIVQIYEFHRDTFQYAVEKCADDYQVAAKAFVQYERRLHMYVVYCQNKPKSEFLVSEYETFFSDMKLKLGHKLTLPDLLIKPVQRIMKYKLLLTDINKFTDRAGEDTDVLQKAMQVMSVVPKACNDMMQVGRLQGFDGKITAQGKLLHQGKLLACEISEGMQFKGKERQIFLFEQSLITADYIKPKNEFAAPNYIYKSSALINKMNLVAEVPGQPLRFLLKPKGGKKEATAGAAPELDIACQAATEEEKQEWIDKIQQLLDTQQDFLRALQAPRAYQKELVTKTDSKDSASGPVSKKKSPLINRIAGHGKKTSEKGVPPHASTSPLAHPNGNSPGPAARSSSDDHDRLSPHSPTTSSGGTMKNIFRTLSGRKGEAGKYASLKHQKHQSSPSSSSQPVQPSGASNKSVTSPTSRLKIFNGFKLKRSSKIS